MYELAETEYECPACSHKEPWRAEASGRPVICVCGVELRIPFQPGLAERNGQVSSAEQTVEIEKEEDAVEETAPQQQEEILLCPDCGAAMRPGAIVCPHCGYRRPRPKRHVIRRRDETGEPRPHVDWTELAIRPIRDRYLPASLTVLGLLIEVVLLANVYHPPLNMLHALGAAPLVVLLSAGTAGAGLLIGLLLAPVLDLSFGPVPPLAIKMTAAVVFPAAAGTFFYFFVGRGVTGIAVGWFISVILYLALFRLLFEFDWPDAMLLVALVCVAHAVILFVVVWPLTQLPSPTMELWTLYKPIVVESILTFVIAGAFVLPHFKEG